MVSQGHWKWYDFLLVFHSNFVPYYAPFLKYLTCKYAVTLKPELVVTQGHRTRHVSIRHLGQFTCYSNQGPLSYRFRYKRSFQSKIAKFSHPMYLCPCWRGSPWNWVPALRGQKARMMWLPDSDQERSLTISSAVLIQYTRVSEWRMWQTDRQTLAKQQRQQTAKTALTHRVAR